MFSATNPLSGQEAQRKIKASVPPEYPELARRMNGDDEQPPEEGDDNGHGQGKDDK
ncbi:MAG TPA: hypothetical protein VFQ41_12295 [Candidatus Angelobacter sp.]|nr:hypothetical protein [Candidatus Angelobacter sp.]